MTIDEAIEVLGVELDSWGGLEEAKGVKALKLGIEALKHCNVYRETNECVFSWLLPGETEVKGLGD